MFLRCVQKLKWRDRFWTCKMNQKRGSDNLSSLVWVSVLCGIMVRREHPLGFQIPAQLSESSTDPLPQNSLIVSGLVFCCRRPTTLLPCLRFVGKSQYECLRWQFQVLHVCFGPRAKPAWLAYVSGFGIGGRRKDSGLGRHRKAAQIIT